MADRSSHMLRIEYKELRKVKFFRFFIDHPCWNSSRGGQGNSMESDAKLEALCLQRGCEAGLLPALLGLILYRYHERSNRHLLR
jgi:hypothetical protein